MTSLRRHHHAQHHHGPTGPGEAARFGVMV